MNTIVYLQNSLCMIGLDLRWLFRLAVVWYPWNHKWFELQKIKQCFTYFRAKRDGIEANVKQEEANIVNLTRELSQAKVQRKMQRALHLEAIKSAQDFSVNQYFVDSSNPTTNPETTKPDFVFSEMRFFFKHLKIGIF